MAPSVQLPLGDAAGIQVRFSKRGKMVPAALSILLILSAALFRFDSLLVPVYCVLVGILLESRCRPLMLYDAALSAVFHSGPAIEARRSLWSVVNQCTAQRLIEHFPHVLRRPLRSSGKCFALWQIVSIWRVVGEIKQWWILGPAAAQVANDIADELDRLEVEVRYARVGRI